MKNSREKYLISADLLIKGDPDYYYPLIEPENLNFPYGTIRSIKKTGSLEIKIKGQMSSGAIKYTLDDILKTAILGANMIKIA